MSFVQSSATDAADDHVAGASPSPCGDAGGGGNTHHGGASIGHKRASRKGAPKRFACPHEGCTSVYTRAEHLRRHQLNHNPAARYHCDEPDCDHRSVRPDLLARHKERHARKRISRAEPPLVPQPQPTGQPRDAAVLLTSESVSPPNVPPVHAVTNAHQPPPVQIVPPHPHRPSWSAPEPQQHGPDEAGTTFGDGARAGGEGRRGLGGGLVRMMEADISVPSSAGVMPFRAIEMAPHEAQAVRDNFTMWLFDPQANFRDFSVASAPLFDPAFEANFKNCIATGRESLSSSSPSAFDTAAQMSPGGPEEISETRRQEVLHWFGVFRQKKPAYEYRLGNLVLERGGDLPGLDLNMMRDCMKEFWDHVSPRMPVVHQHTFSCNGCSVFLLMIMVALGAASLRTRDTSTSLAEYGAFADVIVSGLRWEMLPLATPPVELAAAQALLLLEFFETLYSAREFHERAHVYHTSTLTLLRRGHPLVGRQEIASILDDSEDSRAWWIRWARAESMRRAVFAAFMLDILKAAMFGHYSVMTPDEIQLPLPCMDALWTAPSPDQARSMDANLRMCGIKSVDFNDGLKRALHGEEVKTPAFGRMIIMAGLLNVGWHLKNKEAQLGWLGLKQQSDMGDSWSMILRAFDRWKECLDCDPASELEAKGCSNGLVRSPATLYHLAHMALHVDIVDIQIYAGARRIMGREFNATDFAAAEARLTHWAHQPATRSAVLHSFKLLHRILVDPSAGGGAPLSSGGLDRLSASPSPGLATLATLAHAAVRDPGGGVASGGSVNFVQYSLRRDIDPHQPFVLYLGALSVWAFACALGLMRRQHGQQHNQGAAANYVQYSTYARMAAFLGRVVAHGEAGFGLVGFGDGVRDLVGVVRGILGEAYSEVLREGSERLKYCEDIC